MYIELTAFPLPLVSLYISWTVCVDNSFRGLPLRPPFSCLCLLCSESGRAVVVLHTIRPSTLHYIQTGKNMKLTIDNLHNRLIFDLGKSRQKNKIAGKPFKSS